MIFSFVPCIIGLREQFARNEQAYEYVYSVQSSEMVRMNLLLPLLTSHTSWGQSGYDVVLILSTGWEVVQLLSPLLGI